MLAFSALLSVIPFLPDTYVAMTLLLVGCIRGYDLGNSIGSRWNNSNSSAGQVPVWHNMSQQGQFLLRTLLLPKVVAAKVLPLQGAATCFKIGHLAHFVGLVVGIWWVYYGILDRFALIYEPLYHQ